MVRLFIFVVIYGVWIVVSIDVLSPILKTSQLIGSVLYMAAIFLPFGVLMFIFRTPEWEKKVLSDGKQAMATIVTADDTDFALGHVPLITLHLHVETPEETAFDFTSVQRISAFGRKPGTKVPVKYDPQNTDHVIVLRPDDYTKILDPYDQNIRDGWEGYYRIDQTDPEISAGLEKLAAMHQQGDLSDAEFESAKQKLLT